jgi:hypothetical protein
MAMRNLAAALLLAALTACAAREEPAPATGGTLTGPPSHASGLRASDAAPLAEGITGMVADRIPPSRVAGTVAVQPAEGDALLWPALRDALTGAGYRLAPPDEPRPQHTLTYQVAPLDSDILARATIDGSGYLARTYRRSRSGLVPGPASSMQIDQVR